MTRYQVVRDIPLAWSNVVGVTSTPEPHPEQPEDGFATATEAHMWCITPPRDLGGEWYIKPMEA